MTVIRRTFLAAVVVLAACSSFNKFIATLPSTPSTDGTVVIRAAQVIDGRGNLRSNADITVRNGRIVRIGGRDSVPPGTRLIDLGNRTVLPGLIDAHSHLTWYFNRQGRYHTNADGDTPVQSMLATAANAYATLMAGFTTIQSPGSPEDKDLREWIATQGLAGPRIITSLNALNNQRLTPDSLRALVRQRKAQGADLIKLFASASIRDGGAQTMSDEQIAAVCGEARAQGLRTLVHAHSKESVKASAKGGCTEITHGMFVDQEALDLMAARGAYFQPQCSLVLRNYLDNRAKYDGIGNYNAEGFAAMERALPLAPEVIRRALATRNLKITYGTDAVAGAHGRNAEDMICRVHNSGETPMHVITSATSVTAEALRMGDRIGAIAEGYEADIIALDGDPLRDITAVRSVSFVMKGGKVFRNDGGKP